MKRIYEADNYTIVLNNPENLLIDVQFESVLKYEKKEEKLQLKRTILFTVTGVIMSTLFIILYFSFKSNVILNVATLIVAIAYAIFQFAYLYLRKSLMSKEYKVVVCILIPIFYLLLATLTLIVLFAKANVTLDPNVDVNILDCLIVLVYLSPSFHVLLLLMAGLSYA